MGSSYAWHIDRDYVSNDDPARHGKDWIAVNVAGPSRASGDQVAKAKAGGWPFRIYDDDGILYYTGRLWSEDGFGSEDLFGPLDDYGTPNAGAVTIKYRNPDTGTWDTL